MQQPTALLIVIFDPLEGEKVVELLDVSIPLLSEVWVVHVFEWLEVYQVACTHRWAPEIFFDFAGEADFAALFCGK